jgi:hypothetical protein
MVGTELKLEEEGDLFQSSPQKETNVGTRAWRWDDAGLSILVER